MDFKLKKCSLCENEYRRTYKFQGEYYCYFCYKHQVCYNRILISFLKEPNKVFVISDFTDLSFPVRTNVLNKLIESGTIKKVKAIYQCYNGGYKKINGYKLNKEKLKDPIFQLTLTENILSRIIPI